MPALDKTLPYHAYLLRFWGERIHIPEDAVVWRFSLEDPHTGERRGFANLQQLLAFLDEQIGDGVGLDDNRSTEDGERSKGDFPN
ncbi:MAG: hypothetical protein KDJ97_30895 [Anaerolineae bacterium]|nr:hypothetical protein [Anaerolineae bacterium]